MRCGRLVISICVFGDCLSPLLRRPLARTAAARCVSPRGVVCLDDVLAQSVWERPRSFLQSVPRFRCVVVGVCVHSAPRSRWHGCCISLQRCCTNCTGGAALASDSGVVFGACLSSTRMLCLTDSDAVFLASMRAHELMSCSVQERAERASMSCAPPSAWSCAGLHVPFGCQILSCLILSVKCWLVGHRPFQLITHVCVVLLVACGLLAAASINNSPTCISVRACSVISLHLHLYLHVSLLSRGCMHPSLQKILVKIQLTLFGRCLQDG